MKLFVVSLFVLLAFMVCVTAKGRKDHPKRRNPGLKKGGKIPRGLMSSDQFENNGRPFSSFGILIDEDEDYVDVINSVVEARLKPKPKPKISPHYLRVYSTDDPKFFISENSKEGAAMWNDIYYDELPRTTDNTNTRNSRKLPALPGGGGPHVFPPHPVHPGRNGEENDDSDDENDDGASEVSSYSSSQSYATNSTSTATNSTSTDTSDTNDTSSNDSQEESWWNAASKPVQYSALGGLSIILLTSAVMTCRHYSSRKGQQLLPTHEPTEGDQHEGSNGDNIHENFSDSELGGSEKQDNNRGDEYDNNDYTSGHTNGNGTSTNGDNDDNDDDNDDNGDNGDNGDNENLLAGENYATGTRDPLDQLESNALLNTNQCDTSTTSGAKSGIFSSMFGLLSGVFARSKMPSSIEENNDTSAVEAITDDYKTLDRSEIENSMPLMYASDSHCDTPDILDTSALYSPDSALFHSAASLSGMYKSDNLNAENEIGKVAVPICVSEMVATWDIARGYSSFHHPDHDQTTRATRRGSDSTLGAAVTTGDDVDDVESKSAASTEAEKEKEYLSNMPKGPPLQHSESTDSSNRIYTSWSIDNSADDHDKPEQLQFAPGKVPVVL